MANLEERLAAIWREVLHVPDDGEGDGAHATFFELGGESMSAVRLVARIEDELQVQVDLAEIFEDDPDLAELTRTVRARVRGVTT